MTAFIFTTNGTASSATNDFPGFGNVFYAHFSFRFATPPVAMKPSSDRIAKIEALAERGATEGERAAARAALERLRSRE